MEKQVAFIEVLEKRQAQISENIIEAVARLLEGRMIENKKRFTDKDEIWGLNSKTGSIASMQGLRTVFGAAVALGKDFQDILNIIEPHLESLYEEWNEVLKDIENYGYQAPEYDPKKGLSSILAHLGHSKIYLDAVSWALSTSVVIHFFIKNWPDIALAEKYSEMRLKTRQQIIKSLNLLLKSQNKDGGWNFYPDADSGHLYFTWSATQGIADLGDYVLGESEAELRIPPDLALVGFIEKEVAGFQTKLQNSKEKAIKFLSEKYLQKSIKGGLSKEDLKDNYIQVVFSKDIPSSDLVMTYCEAYLLEALIILGYDIGDKNKRIELDKLYTRILGKMPLLSELDFANDSDLSTFHIKISKTQKGLQGTWEFLLQDGGLWPQLLRTMILYKFYVVEERQIDERIVGLDSDSPLTLLIGSKREIGEQIGDGLWDSTAFNLAITSRAIEGLIDCFDYYSRIIKHFGLGAPSFADVEPDLAKFIAEAIFPYILDKLPKQQEPPEKKLFREEKIVDLLGAAAEPLDRGTRLNFDEFLKTLMTNDAKTQLSRENKDAYKILKAIVAISFFVSARLWDHILSEAIIFQENSQERIADFRRHEKDPGYDSMTLHQRIRTMLEKIAHFEFQALEDKSIKTPDYDRFLRILISGEE